MLVRWMYVLPIKHERQSPDVHTWGQRGSKKGQVRVAHGRSTTCGGLKRVDQQAGWNDNQREGLPTEQTPSLSLAIKVSTVWRSTSTCSPGPRLSHSGCSQMMGAASTIVNRCRRLLPRLVAEKSTGSK